MPAVDRHTRDMRLLACLVLAATIWVSTLHLWFTDRTRPLAARQLALWEGEPDLAALRRQNPEWDLMARMFAVLTFANLALGEPAMRTRYLAAIDRIIDRTIADVERAGMHHFLLPYARDRPFVDGPSLFVDGELALMVAARQLVERDGRENVWAERVVRQIERGPALLAESYPDEVWLFCNAVALAAVRIDDVVDGAPGRHAALFARWVANARRLVDRETGLLPAKTGYHGEVREGPEGSTLWVVAAMLRIVDDDFARDQYERARAVLYGRLAGFGWAREWPTSAPGADDIDSGPTVPLVGANAGSSGLALVAAHAVEDENLARELGASLELAGFPIDGRYARGNQLADAVIVLRAGERPAVGACAMRRIVVIANAVVVGLFALLHVLGARAEMGFLADGRVSVVGLAYFLGYFAVVLWVPISTLAVILDAACGRLVQTWRTSRRP